MKIKNTKSNLVILTPEEGYLLKKSGKTYKNVILGMHDKPNAYEEIKDPNYIDDNNKDIIEEDNTPLQQEESFYVLTSPSGKRFKLTVDDNGELKTTEIK